MGGSTSRFGPPNGFERSRLSAGRDRAPKPGDFWEVGRAPFRDQILVCPKKGPGPDRVWGRVRIGCGSVWSGRQSVGRSSRKWVGKWLHQRLCVRKRPESGPAALLSTPLHVNFYDALPPLEGISRKGLLSETRKIKKQTLDSPNTTTNAPRVWSFCSFLWRVGFSLHAQS